MSESLKFIRKKIDSRSPVEDVEFRTEIISKPVKKTDKYLDFLEKIYVDVLDSRVTQD